MFKESKAVKSLSVSIRSAYKTILKIYGWSFTHSTNNCIYLQNIFFLVV